MKEQLVEKNYLKKALTHIYKTIEKNKNNIKENEQDALKMKQYIWQNARTMDSAELNFYKDIMNTNYSSSKRSYIENIALNDMKDHPYHSRIDFYDDIFDENLIVYIGIINVFDDESNLLVYDWRSPIASLFYENEPGKCYYEAPQGKIYGDLKLKRQYKIEKGELIYYFNSSISITDEVLQEVLSKNSSTTMQNIVSTIQREQNIVIRNCKDRVLFVTGPAGCGKTSVALHHIAYLLYRNREKLSSNDILIFSPNEYFSKYISDVLPSLGENNILQTEFSKYITNFLEEFKKIESYSEFLERISDLEDEKIKIIKKKMSKDFCDTLTNIISNISDFVSCKDIVVNGDLIFTEDDCMKLFTHKFNNYPLYKNIEKTINYIKTYIRNEKNIIINNHDLDSYLRSRISYKKFYEILDCINSKLNKKEGFDISYKGKLTYEDSLLLLWIKGKLYGLPYDTRIKQIVIDEAQDYIWLQMKLIKEIFINAFFTILGDDNQKLNICSNDTILSFKEIFKDYQNKYIYLNTCYRNGYEITEFCNNILSIKNVNPINRHVAVPKTYKINNALDRLNKLKDLINNDITAGISNIAIIVKNNNMAKKIESKLPSYKNLQILPVYIAKGLEFDSVIVYDDNKIEESFDKKSLYVACSRALHRLNVISK